MIYRSFIDQNGIKAMDITTTHYVIKHPDGRFIKKDARNSFVTYKHKPIIDPYTPEVLKAKWFKSEKQALNAADRFLQDFDFAIEILKDDINYTIRQIDSTHKISSNQKWINELEDRIKDCESKIDYYIHSKPPKIDIAIIESVHTVK